MRQILADDFSTFIDLLSSFLSSAESRNKECKNTLCEYHTFLSLIFKLPEFAEKHWRGFLYNMAGSKGSVCKI